jgi:hypothetical protein
VICPPAGRAYVVLPGTTGYSVKRVRLPKRVRPCQIPRPITGRADVVRRRTTPARHKRASPQTRSPVPKCSSVSRTREKRRANDPLAVTKAHTPNLSLTCEPRAFMKW